MVLKQNQKNLLEDVKEYFKDLESWQGSEWQEIDKVHGRIEKRSCWALEIGENLKHHEWPHLKTIALVRSSRQIKGKETVEYRYYISSLRADAESLCKVARRHWSIENKLHWVLDVTFNEDKGCIRNDNAPENIDIIRKWFLNVINKYRKEGESIRSVQRKGSMSFKHMVKILENEFIKKVVPIYY
jgi:predicted transposase YbfD/YdcC